MEEKDDLIKEWEDRVRQIPVATIKNEASLKKYVKDNGLTKDDLAILLTIVVTSLPDFKNITISKETVCTLTFGELLEWHDKTQVQFIIIHRVNYLIHEAMITVYDLLEKDKRLKFMVKKESKLAEEAWENYVGPRRKTTPREAWFTMQDHLRIVHDMLRPRIEKVYESIRDYMIRLGWRDVEIKARIEVALLLVKVGKYSFRAFFKEFEEASGADFSKCFAYADMSAMEKHFAQMAVAAGVTLRKAEGNGGYDVDGFYYEQSQRVKWAWDAFINALRDNDLMDEAAVRAIGLNPTVEADYKKAIEEAEEKQMEEHTERLSERFKVTKHKK